MRFGSVCSGIEAASVAWHPLGWQAAWLSEIEPFPSAVLAHHYPDVPNLGDMTTLPARISSGEVEAPDLFCGGTPCQAFSIAGMRKSLDDARGNLSLTFCEIANAIDQRRRDAGSVPAIIFWENVPGVLSTKDNAFGCFLAGLAGEEAPVDPPRGKWTNAGVILGPQRAVAWRILDAQYFGVAQRRRRVFVVASARDDFDPATVLFEWDGVRRDSAPCRETGKVAPTIPSRSTAGGGLGTDFDCDGGVISTFAIQAGALRTNPASGPDGVGIQAEHAYTLEARAEVQCVAHSLRAEGFDASEDGTGRGTPLVPVPMINMQGSKGNAVAQADGPSFTLNAMHGHDVHAIAVPDIAGTMKACKDSGGWSNSADHAAAGYMVPVAFHPTQDPISSADVCHSLGANDNATAAVAYNIHGVPASNGASVTDVHVPLRARQPGQSEASTTTVVQTAMAVRRLTPVECERLQGFPDHYTAIPWRKKPASECPDGPRYKALGNSWAVPVVRWIGERIRAAVTKPANDNHHPATEQAA